MKNKILIFTALMFVLTFNLSAENPSGLYLKDLSGNYLTWDELKGENLTIVDFWATWCKPCVTSMPEINKLYETFTEKGVQIIGINADGPRNTGKVRPFVHSMGIDYPVLLDPDQEAMGLFNVSALPTMLIYNQNDELIYRHEGFQPGDEILLEEKINQWLSGK